MELLPCFDHRRKRGDGGETMADEESLLGLQAPLKIRPGPAATFGLLDALFVLAAVVGLDFIRAVLPPASLGNLAQQLITASVVLAYLAIRSRLSRSALFGRMATRGMLLLGIGAGLGMWVLSAATTLGLRVIFGWDDPVYPIWTVVRPIADISLWAVISSLIVAPPLEEVVFRSVMFRGIATRLLPWVAALIVSVLFAWQHVGGDFAPIDAFWAFVLSVIAIQFLRRTGSLWPAVALHGTYNATTVIGGLVLFQLIGWGYDFS